MWAESEVIAVDRRKVTFAVKAFDEKGGEKEAPEEGGAGEGEGGGLEVAAEGDEDGESQDGEGEDGQN